MIISVGSYKGGTGKSTVATNLAVAAALAGHRPILVDADPIATSSRWASDREDDGHTPAISCVQKTGSLVQTLRDLDQAYTHVIVDVAGRDSRELRSSMSVADLLVIPSRVGQADIDVLQGLNDAIDQALDFNPDLTARILWNCVPTAAFSSELADAQGVVRYEHLGQLNTALHERKAYRDAMAEGRSVLETNKHKAATEFAEAAKEIFNGA
ncbi:AAA family ATPase [Pseudoclavibacter alba]|uniref:AAA family ATPase n=1 Tax=Pseudoclavibacter albus TaxID=272241 RepID=A0ABT2HXP0_9MICO|nr:division plane positioning ATPase MipZ [Pseudoclavibacter alba]MCT2043074.1 AAA family ATPase [Pseudoclavibacter alba]